MVWLVDAPIRLPCIGRLTEILWFPKGLSQVRYRRRSFGPHKQSLIQQCNSLQVHVGSNDKLSIFYVDEARDKWESIFCLGDNGQGCALHTFNPTVGKLIGFIRVMSFITVKTVEISWKSKQIKDFIFSQLFWEELIWINPSLGWLLAPLPGPR